MHGESSLIPFRQLGQYEDSETGLYYNRFRYYSPETGTYISQDPIGLAGNNPNFYGYVFDSNSEVDVFGLDLHHIIPNQIYKEFKDSFDAIDDYVQNVYKTGSDKTNLTSLDRPFHGNHPAYNDHVRNKVQQLVDADELNLSKIRELQDDLLKKIDDAKKAGGNLNDFFKKGCK